MVRKLTVFAMGLFLVAFIAVVLQINATRPRILVLHSYSEDYIWTSEINIGLKRIFDEHSWIDVRYHEMKTKKISGKDYQLRAGIAARKAIETNTPDVLIAIDDLAQKLAAKYYINVPDMSIVFAGINGSIEPYGYQNAKNVTGILERKPAAALKEVVELIHQSDPNKSSGRTRVMFLGDTSHSVERDSSYLDTYDWGTVDYLGLEAVKTYGEWKKTVKALGDRTDFVLVGGYRKVKRSASDKKFVPAKEIMSWTEANSPVPVIGMNIFNTDEGAMLSVGVSPYEQGEVAASMAIDIIDNGTSPSNIEVQTSSQYIISLRSSALEKRNIKVPDIFEAFARATAHYFE